MADLQLQMRKFHDVIKLKNTEENATLREKKAIILDKVRANIRRDFQSRGETPPTFDDRNQGSYAMHTGVQPIAGDYDIDVGLVFNISKDDHDNPTRVKGWVADALRGHTVEWKDPCITVQYQRKGEPIYHVDLPVYARDTAGNTWLARGHRHSSAANRGWERSDFGGLIDTINGRHSGEDREQFRRVIRYLKRWKDTCFPTRGEAAPVGIGLTVAAYHWFQPQATARWSGRRYSDLDATRQLVGSMLSRFQRVRGVYRLSAALPVAPFDSPFDRMSDPQSDRFYRKLSALKTTLDSAARRSDPAAAAEELRAHFGAAFPVPKRSAAAVSGTAPIISSGQSA